MQKKVVEMFKKKTWKSQKQKLLKKDSFAKISTEVY